MKIGEVHLFSHRLEPRMPMIQEQGEIIGEGVTLDGKYYVETTVGSHTKKYVVDPRS